jgi:hypothetical protein
MSDSGANTFGPGAYPTKPLDPNEFRTEASEFSWGLGVDIPGYENAPPSEGGRYRGTSPHCEKRVNVGKA